MTAAAQPPSFDLARLVAWPRLRLVLLVGFPFGLLLSIGSAVTPAWVWVARALTVALLATLCFGLLEQRPVRLPRWLGRWAAQLLGVVAAAPIGALIAYWITTGTWHFWHDPSRLNGFAQLSFTSLFFGPWIAMTAMVRQRDAQARHQAAEFERQRGELERQALDARLRLMQAQVQPHFLFNTLANVRALVKAGSPQATAVLDSLIAYLRAAVPRLERQAGTVGEEIELVRAYLSLMHMRMPDRLQYTIHADEAALPLHCPPTTVLTLVENAVRHGIDPSEEGGRIEVSVSARDEGRCIARVIDTGVGLQPAERGLGTGLAGLRERLQLCFGRDAVRLSLAPLMPHGTCAEVEFPAGVSQGAAA